MRSLSTYLLHTLILARFELRELLGGWKALLGLVLYGLLLCGAAYAILSAEREMSSSIGAVKEGLASAEFRDLCEQLGFKELPTLVKYLARHSGVVWMFQVIGLFWYPIFIMLLSFDAVATDVNRGTQRFIIQRASRASYLSAKFLAHNVFYLTLHALAVATVYLAAKDSANSATFSSSLFQFGLSMAVFIVFLSCTTVFVSSLCRSAGRALVWTQLFWVITMIAGIFVPWLNPLRIDWMVGLFMPDTEHGLAAVSGFAAWSVSLLALALIRWERKEL